MSCEYSPKEAHPHWFGHLDSGYPASGPACERLTAIDNIEQWRDTSMYVVNFSDPRCQRRGVFELEQTYSDAYAGCLCDAVRVVAARLLLP